MKWIGLTGGIATGKSTVARLIESLGYPVIDADLISHQLTKFGEKGYQAIVSHFGNLILKENNELDRNKLAEIIFSDVIQKKKLEDILHPLIHEEVLKLKTKYKNAGATHCFYDVPLLFEKNLQQDFDFVVTVWCDFGVQRERLIRRNHLTLAEANIRIESQMALADKIAQSKYCIDNSGSEESLIQIVSNWLDLV